MVKEEWFQEAIEDRPDVFLIAGHMTIRDEPDSEFTAVFNAIRIVHPTVPILIFGGHHHVSYNFSILQLAHDFDSPG